MSKQLIEKLSDIQKRLKAPKGQHNKFGNYYYRSCEDILEAVKPLLAEHKLVQTISDHVFEIGGRVYIRSTVRVTDGESEVENCAFARESEEKKGMDSAQITGSTSSYARKYALNGMYAIDDTKDSDATNTHGKEQTLAPKAEQPVAPPKTEAPKPGTNEAPAPARRSFRKSTTSEDL